MDYRDYEHDVLPLDNGKKVVILIVRLGSRREGLTEDEISRNVFLIGEDEQIEWQVNGEIENNSGLYCSFYSFESNILVIAKLDVLYEVNLRTGFAKVIGESR